LRKAENQQHIPALQQQQDGTERKHLTDEQKKAAKGAAHAIAKARLAPLFCKHKISKEVYSSVLKDATHTLYERVKAGHVALEPVLAAAGAAARGAAEGSSSAGAIKRKMVAMLNAMLEDAGVAARL
jgi:triosephosphate isomerase